MDSSAAGHKRLSPYATPSATREVLEKHGLYTKYALGQNFLVNDDVVRKIVDLSEVGEDDHVLEVGPGIGTLTAALLQRAGHVTSIEMDADLPAVLADTLAPWQDKFTLLQMDAVDYPKAVRGEGLRVGQSSDTLSSTLLDGRSADAPSSTPPDGRPTDALSSTLPFRLPNKLVSNLPYAVAATIVLEYLQKLENLQSATVMVQKEVADRMMAKPGSKTYGAYTVKLSLYSQPVGRFAVAAGNFFPPPRVESAVLRLDRICSGDADATTPLTPDELEATCTMADAAFATRRKTIANSCKTFFAGSPEIQAVLPDVFSEAGIDSRRRGETLEREEFIRLGRALLACS